MKPQIVHDSKGNNSGVFIPIEDWLIIKKTYPDIEQVDNEAPEWLKQLLDERLKDIAQNPDSIRPIDELFEELDS